MSKGNNTETDMIKVVFYNNFDPGWRANANLYLALHTGDPGEGGDQTTYEATYTNYARVAVAKTAAGWTVTTGQAQNAGLIQFNQCGASGNTVSHVSIGVSDSPSAGQILYSGALNSNLNVSNLIQPQFGIGALTITED
jgi:hypothetical protein